MVLPLWWAGMEMNNSMLFDVGNDIMIGGSGANYFDCGPNGNGVLDLNPAKGDTKSSDCKYVITTYSNNIFRLE